MVFQDQAVMDMGSKISCLLDIRKGRLAEKSEKSNSLLPVKRQIRRGISISGSSYSEPVSLWLKSFFYFRPSRKTPDRCLKFGHGSYSPSGKANLSSSGQEIPVFYGTQQFITAFTKSRHEPHQSS